MKVNINRHVFSIEPSKGSMISGVILAIVVFTITTMFAFMTWSRVMGVIWVLSLIVWMAFIISAGITSGYGGFPYWNLFYTNKKTDKNTVSEAEEEKLMRFLSDSNLQVGDTYDCEVIKCYCTCCDNGTITIEADNGFKCTMRTPVKFTVGEEFFVIRDYCFLKSYLESIDYNYSRYAEDQQKWVVDSLNRVVPVN